MTTPDYKAFYDAVINHLIVVGIYQNHHEHNPVQALQDIINWELELYEDFSDDEWEPEDLRDLAYGGTDDL